MATIAEISRHLGISSRRASELIAVGVLPKAGRGMHDLDAAREAYHSHLREVAAGRGSQGGAFDLVAERARLAKEQADQIAMKNEKMRGDLISYADVLAANQAVMTAVRARLLALPPKLAQPLAMTEDPAEAQEIIRQGVYEALIGLSELTFEDDEDTDEN